MDCYFPLPINERKLQEIVHDAKDFVYGLGNLVRCPKNPSSHDAVIHAPFTLFPSPFPRWLFQQACLVQTDLNLLMHRVANDPEFLEDCLESVIKVDDFTHHLWVIYQTVLDEGNAKTDYFKTCSNSRNRKIQPEAKPATLALSRSDYMVGPEEDGDDAVMSDETVNVSSSANSQPSAAGQPKLCLHQIEFNTMAASFAGLSQNLTSYHRFFLDRHDVVVGHAKQIYKVPENGAATGLADAMVDAWNLYGKAEAVVLFLVSAVERNIYDQRSLEYHIYENHGEVKVIRRTLQQIRSGGFLTPNKELIVDDMEVAIVYQRSCYKPSDFTSEADWQTRLMIEQSQAIVCPSIAYHLAGTKKVQQVLAQPGVLELFMGDKAAIKRIRMTFASQFSLDLDEEGDANVEMALKNPALFVLKPQREGGGNNTFGEAVRDELLKLKGSSERSSYVLMRRVHPIVFRNYPVAANHPVELREMVSELGIYGSIVAQGDEIISNKQQGYLLRTKQLGTDEGGVATGYSVLDSPYLVDSWPVEEHTSPVGL